MSSGPPEQAFEAVLAVRSKVETAQEKAELCQAAFQIAQRLGTHAVIRTRDLSKQLLPGDNILVKLLEIAVLFAEGRGKEAGPALEAIRDEDDPHWLQWYAQYLELIGDGGEAARYMLKAAELLPHPTLLEAAAGIAFDEQRSKDAVEALEKKLRFDPNDVQAHNNAAFIYTRLDDFQNAATHFRRLSEIEPNEPRHRLNYAASLVEDGSTESAITVYDELVRKRESSARRDSGPSPTTEAH